MWEQVVDGGLLDLSELSYLDGFLAEEQRGKLEIDLRQAIPESIVTELRNRLASYGIPDLRVYSSSPMLTIEYRKGMPWIPIIVGAILGLIALAILVVGWRFFREVADVIPEPLKPLLGIGLLALLGLAVVSYGKRTFLALGRT